MTTVGSGFAEQTNAAAFVLGPTGVGLSPGGTLYVADTREQPDHRHPGALFRRAQRGHRAGC